MPYSCRDLWWSLYHLRLCVWFFWTPRTWRSDGELRSEVSCTLMGQRMSKVPQFLPQWVSFQHVSATEIEDFSGFIEGFLCIISLCIRWEMMGVYSQNGRASHQELLQFTVYIFRNGNLVLKASRYLTLKIIPPILLQKATWIKKWIWCCGFERTPVPYP